MNYADLISSAAEHIVTATGTSGVSTKYKIIGLHPTKVGKSKSGVKVQYLVMANLDNDTIRIELHPSAAEDLLTTGEAKSGTESYVYNDFEPIVPVAAEGTTEVAAEVAAPVTDKVSELIAAVAAEVAAPVTANTVVVTNLTPTVKSNGNSKSAIGRTIMAEYRANHEAAIAKGDVAAAKLWIRARCIEALRDRAGMATNYASTFYQTEKAAHEANARKAVTV